MKRNGHIVFLAHFLGQPGGIERAIVNTANLLSGHGYKVTILVLDHSIESFYPLDPEITIVCDALAFGIGGKGDPVSRKLRFLKDVFRLRKILKQSAADVAVGTFYTLSIPMRIACFSTGIRTVAWEHHHAFHLKGSRFWRFLKNKVYPGMDRVVCLNEDERKSYLSLGCTVSLIPNFLFQLPVRTNRERERLILTVGWLSHTKGMDQIPEIAATILKKNNTWHWLVIGTGPLKDELQREVAAKGLDGLVTLQDPERNDLSEIYRKTSLYVMPSRHECFPMVLLEAQSYGVPCVAFDCETGPRHIILQNRSGLLVKPGDIHGMIHAIDLLMREEEKREEMRAPAEIRALDFTAEKVFPLWKSLLDEL